MELNDNGKGISGIAHKADYSGSHDEKAGRFAKAFSEFLKSLIHDAGITDEEWKETFEGYDEAIGEILFLGLSGTTRGGSCASFYTP